MSQDGATTETREALYGDQTGLALRCFGAPGRRIGDIPAFIRHYALVKKAAAMANHGLGVLDERRANAIVAACDEVASGRHQDQFPTALVLGGGGTTANMNLNEVIAARSTQIASVSVHPNDHVNASQSTNDTLSTAMALTIIDSARTPVAALTLLADALQSKADEHHNTPYLGRTCLQDAVTVRVGDTFRAQAHALHRGAGDVQVAAARLSAVPLGATVLGTAIGAPAGFTQSSVEHLRALVDIDVRAAEDPFDTLAHLDPYAAVADAANRAAITVAKIAADLRLRSSGPGGGLAEVTLPALQAGSSIMPAKVNPIVPEYAIQLSYRIRGATHTIACAVAAGELELNVMEPVIIDSLLDIFDDLSRAATAMATLCVNGMTWNGARRRENLTHVLDQWVEHARRHGYDAATDKASGQRSSAELDPADASHRNE